MNGFCQILLLRSSISEFEARNSSESLYTFLLIHWSYEHSQLLLNHMGLSHILNFTPISYTTMTWPDCFYEGHFQTVGSLLTTWFQDVNFANCFHINDFCFSHFSRNF